MEVKLKSDDPMWAIVMFDLPVDTKIHRREATRYRNFLLNLGFSRIQFSVYARYLISADGVNWLSDKIGVGIPDGGLVRLLAVTDAQWISSIAFEGKILARPESPPDQLTIF